MLLNIHPHNPFLFHKFFILLFPTFLKRFASKIVVDSGLQIRFDPAMRKSLVTIFFSSVMVAATFLASNADASTLLYGLDFNDLNEQNLTNLGSGTTAIGRTNGYINWSGDDLPLADGGYAHRVNGGTFNISSSSGIDGINLSTGFSVGLHLKNGNNPVWQNALSITFGTTTIRVEMTSSTQWVIYNGADIGIPQGTLLFQADPGNWDYLGLTFQGDKMNVYKNGQLTNSITTGLSDSTLVTGIRGGGEHAATNSQVYIDNVAVYDGVLNGNDFAYLSQHAMPAELVPEPASASLSLLGLASLLMRRRRK